MKEWPSKAYGWYQNACKVFDYPAGPYGNALRDLIARDDTVLDLGCGIGAASILISPWCKEIIAMDQDENALNHLSNNARDLQIHNIKTLHDSWPVKAPVKTDVIIALHVQKAMRSLANLELVFDSANKGGFIASQAPVSEQDEPFRELKKALGIPLNAEKCDNACYIKGALEALGASVTCEKKVYDFGQPLDTVEEVFEFISWQITADISGDIITEDTVTQTIKKFSSLYTGKTDGKYLVPLKRHCCAVSFVKT